MSTLSLGALFTAHLVLCVSPARLTISPQSQPEEETGTPGKPAASPWVRSRSRRIMDFTVAALALAILFPLLVLCWIMVRFTSPGPAFFRQKRMGKDGVEFVLYKFRSMRLERRGERAGHTVVGDRRITRVGGWMRRYKLDELPQFWNVLRGDMSLVGPRPKLAEHEALRMPYRPGLTGRATLAFRHEECMLFEVPRGEVDQFYQFVVKPIKAQLDIEYMQSATFLSDLRLLFSTFTRCVNCNVDAREELLLLMERYTPERLFTLDVDQRKRIPVSIRAPQPLLNDLRDNLADDDAA